MGDTETADTGTVETLFDPWVDGYVGDAVVGQEAFVRRCATCHGEAGRGGLGPDLASVVPFKTDVEIYTIVVEGNGAAMPRIAVDVQEGVDIVTWLADTFRA